MFRRYSVGHLSKISLVLLVLVFGGFACNLLTDEATEVPTIEVVNSPVVQATIPQQLAATHTPTEDAGPPAVGGEIAELAKATVQIFALWDSGSQWDIVWTGSGSIISPDGFILTNAHVVDNRYDEYTDLGIALTDRTDQPPELMYLAEISAVDYTLDLAVIRIVQDLDGNLLARELPYINIGDSDIIEIGETLRILGFPGIGGDTITFTEGAISGFTQERGIDGRAWIKTDATIAGGNSGGMAVNTLGELIGVPTQASAGGDQIVDCRPVADTNRDGYIDDQDTCVPIGGFINGLRPINLARPLIEAALSMEEYVGGSTPQEMPTGGYDLSETDFSYLEFADGVTEDDQPTQLWWSLPSGTLQICAFWDYVGMVDGMVWSAYWYADGELDEGKSFIDITWQGGPEGNWWVCMYDETGLGDGTYELILGVEGETMISDAIFVGGERNLIDFTLLNNSSTPICYVYFSPTTAQNWGQDELGATEIIDAGYERVFPLVTGDYDLLFSDCDGNTLYDVYGVSVFDNYTFTLTD
jgi:serine protease Do